MGTGRAPAARSHARRPGTGTPAPSASPPEHPRPAPCRSTRLLWLLKPRQSRSPAGLHFRVQDCHYREKKNHSVRSLICASIFTHRRAHPPAQGSREACGSGAPGSCPAPLRGSSGPAQADGARHRVPGKHAAMARHRVCPPRPGRETTAAVAHCRSPPPSGRLPPLPRHTPAPPAHWREISLAAISWR